jgi:hypothetical protein
VPVGTEVEMERKVGAVLGTHARAARTAWLLTARAYTARREGLAQAARVGVLWRDLGLAQRPLTPTAAPFRCLSSGSSSSSNNTTSSSSSSSGDSNKAAQAQPSFQLVGDDEDIVATSSLDTFSNTVSTTHRYALDLLNEACLSIVMAPSVPHRQFEKVLRLDPNCYTAKALQAFFLVKSPTLDNWETFVALIGELEAVSSKGKMP